MDLKEFSTRELKGMFKSFADEQGFGKMAEDIKKELAERIGRPKKHYIIRYDGIEKRVDAINYHEALETVDKITKGTIKEGRKKEQRFNKEKSCAYLY